MVFERSCRRSGLADVDHDMAIMREETFGPILPIMRVQDEEAALRLANDSRYGLNANVWTRNKRKGIERSRIWKCWYSALT